MKTFIALAMKTWLKMTLPQKILITLSLSPVLGSLFFGIAGSWLHRYFSENGYPLILWSCLGTMVFLAFFLITHVILKKNQELIERKKELEERRHELIEINCELQEKNTRLKDLALRDPTTGLRNTRFTEEEAPMLVGRARRERKLLCLCYFDIDDFRIFNNTYGHAIGDAVLKRFAKELRAIFARTDDVVSRKGEASDEFVAVWIATEMDKTLRYVNDVVRKNMHGLSFYTEKGMEEITFNVSVGFACMDFTTDNVRHNANDDNTALLRVFRELEAAADKNLYKEKTKKAGG